MLTVMETAWPSQMAYYWKNREAILRNNKQRYENQKALRGGEFLREAARRSKEWRLKNPEKYKAIRVRLKKRKAERANGIAMAAWEGKKKAEMLKEKTCANCQKFFKSAYSESLYCSRACSRSAASKRRRKRLPAVARIVCLKCGIPFDVPRQRRGCIRYCSDACRKTAEKIQRAIYRSRPESKSRRREWLKSLPRSHPTRLKIAVMSSIREALKKQRNKKKTRTAELIGCTVPFLKTYLENKFTNGMSWENQGRNGWHIDHIRPCTSFDLSKVEEQKKCFHYTNLQPLWESENIRKSNKILTATA